MRNSNVKLGIVWSVIVLVLIWLCLWIATSHMPDPPTHNPQGGYIDQCGDLPGMVGDDC